MEAIRKIVDALESISPEERVLEMGFTRRFPVEGHSVIPLECKVGIVRRGREPFALVRTDLWFETSDDAFEGEQPHPETVDRLMLTVAETWATILKGLSATRTKILIPHFMEQGEELSSSDILERAYELRKQQVEPLTPSVLVEERTA